MARATSSDTAPYRTISPLRHAEHLVLARLRIGDEAALEDVGRARDLGQRAGDQAAGAAFGGRELQPLAARALDKRFRQAPRMRSGNISDQSFASAARRKAPRTTPATRSSTMTPTPPGKRLEPPTSARASHMSNRRNRKKRQHVRRASRRRRIERDRDSASHCPATSSITHSDGSAALSPAACASAGPDAETSAAIAAAATNRLPPEQ